MKRDEVTRHERTTIDLSLQVLREATIRARTGKIDTVDVRLALRCLLPHCPERWPLTQFWDGCARDNDGVRAQVCGASFNGIVRQLGLPPE